MGEYERPKCGARLDPGEKCDCEEGEEVRDYSDRDIDRMLGEYERPNRWPYQDEELYEPEEDEDDGTFGL